MVRFTTNWATRSTKPKFICFEVRLNTASPKETTSRVRIDVPKIDVPLFDKHDKLNCKYVRLHHIQERELAKMARKEFQAHMQNQTEPPPVVAANGSEAAEAAAADGEESRNRTMRQPSGGLAAIYVSLRCFRLAILVEARCYTITLNLNLVNQ